MSEDALIKAKARMLELEKEDVHSKPTSLENENKSASFCGFQTASGKTVTVSEDALMKARARMLELEKENAVLSKLSTGSKKDLSSCNGMQKASGNSVEDALMKAKARINQLEMDDVMSIEGRNGAHSASGGVCEKWRHLKENGRIRRSWPDDAFSKTSFTEGIGICSCQIATHFFKAEGKNVQCENEPIKDLVESSSMQISPDNIDPLTDNSLSTEVLESANAFLEDESFYDLSELVVNNPYRHVDIPSRPRALVCEKDNHVPRRAGKWQNRKGIIVLLKNQCYNYYLSCMVVLNVKEKHNFGNR